MIDQAALTKFINEYAEAMEVCEKPEVPIVLVLRPEEAFMLRQPISHCLDAEYGSDGDREFLDSVLEHLGGRILQERTNVCQS